MTVATLTARPPRRVLPGFGLTLGYTVLYLSLIVLIPLSALVFKTFTLSWEQFWTAVASPRVLASYQLTFGASFIAAVAKIDVILATHSVQIVNGRHDLMVALAGDQH